MARSAAGAVTARQMAAVMGRSLGMREVTATYQTLHERVRAGLPYAALATLVARYALTGNEVVAVLRIPKRTLARRKLARRLPPDESDRLLRLARIGALAEEVLGAPERAAGWLRAPNRALAGAAPLHLLATEVGAREVETILQRLAHGIYS